MNKLRFKNLKGFQQYEKTYSKDEIVLFNSRYLKSDNEVDREKGIMSNLYSNNYEITFHNNKFNSAEQLLYYINFLKYGEKVADVPTLVTKFDLLFHCKNGLQVKNTPRVKYFFEKIESWKKKNLGFENCLFDSWKNLYLIVRYKYKYCKEFREILEKYKDKVYCEDSNWGDNFCGVVWDDELGKYRGINALGRVMKRVYFERDEIMKE